MERIEEENLIKGNEERDLEFEFRSNNDNFLINDDNKNIFSMLDNNYDTTLLSELDQNTITNEVNKINENVNKIKSRRKNIMGLYKDDFPKDLIGGSLIITEEIFLNPTNKQNINYEK